MLTPAVAKAKVNLVMVMFFLCVNRTVEIAIAPNPKPMYERLNATCRLSHQTDENAGRLQKPVTTPTDQAKTLTPVASKAIAGLEVIDMFFRWVIRSAEIVSAPSPKPKYDRLFATD